MDEQEAKRLAEEHWKFLESWMHRIFVDGFVHGYKHSEQRRIVWRSDTDELR